MRLTSLARVRAFQDGDRWEVAEGGRVALWARCPREGGRSPNLVVAPDPSLGHVASIQASPGFSDLSLLFSQHRTKQPLWGG